MAGSVVLVAVPVLETIEPDGIFATRWRLALMILAQENAELLGAGLVLVAVAVTLARRATLRIADVA